AGDAVLARPQLEDRVGRSLAQVRVVDRAPAHPAPLEDANAQVFGRATAGVLKEARDHLVFALIEVARRQVRPLFEGDDVEPRARELAQRQRAARSPPVVVALTSGPS